MVYHCYTHINGYTYGESWITMAMTRRLGDHRGNFAPLLAVRKGASVSSKIAAPILPIPGQWAFPVVNRKRNACYKHVQTISLYGWLITLFYLLTVSKTMCRKMLKSIASHDYQISSMHISSCFVIMFSIFSHQNLQPAASILRKCSHQVTCKWKSCAGQASPAKRNLLT